MAAAPVTDVYGRGAEVATLTRMLDRLEGGCPTRFFVEGEAGIGKSRLLDVARTLASSRDVTVLAGRGEEFQQSRPFGMIARAFECTRSSDDPGRRSIADLLAAGDDEAGRVSVTSDPGLQYRVVDAFVDIAEALALERPLLLVLDDLQWIDPSSVLTLQSMVARLGDVPMGLLGALRPMPRSPQLRRALIAFEDAGAEQLGLSPLDPGAVEAIAAERLAAVPGPALLSELADAGGNPLFVLAILAALRQEGSLRVDGRHVDAVGGVRAPTLRLTILRRLSFLSDATLSLLRLASVHGSSFTLADLLASTGLDELEIAEGLTEAIEARMLNDEGGQLRFRHDLIRDALYDDMPVAVRTALHRTAGRQLAAAGAPAGQIAEHLSRGAQLGDADAVTWLVNAAREALRKSPDEAVDLFDRALRFMLPGDPQRDEIEADHAGVLGLAGRITESESASRRLLARAHAPSVTAAAHIYLGRALLTGGQPRDALVEFDRALGAASLTDDERVNALSWASISRLWLGDLDGALEVADEVRERAEAVAAYMPGTAALGVQALVDALRGRLDAALERSAAAVEFADRTPQFRGHRYPVSAVRAFVLIESDDIAQAAAVLEAGARMSENLGLAWHLPSYQMQRTVQLFTVGAWDDALPEIDASRRFSQETGERYNLIVTGSVESLIYLHRNDIAGAAAAAEAAVRRLDDAGSRYRSQWALYARALVHEAEGDDHRALETMLRGWQMCAEHGHVLEYRIFGPDLVRLALAAGDDTTAERTATAVETLSGTSSVVSVRGAALRCRGLLTDDPVVLLEAVRTLDAGPRVLDRAAACEEAAAALLRRGEPEQARPLSVRALELYGRLDATRDTARVTSTLRRYGVRAGTRGRRRARPQHGWASLTDTERTVAELVAEGLTNPMIGERLFVSRRTVQSHLGHVFSKLGISSRAQLAAEVTRGRNAAPTAKERP